MVENRVEWFLIGIRLWNMMDIVPALLVGDLRRRAAGNLWTG